MPVNHRESRPPYQPPFVFARYVDFPLVRHRQVRCRCGSQFSPRTRFGRKDDDIEVECRNCQALLLVNFVKGSPRFIVAEVSDEDLEYIEVTGMEGSRQLTYLMFEPVRKSA